MEITVFDLDHPVYFVPGKLFSVGVINLQQCTLKYFSKLDDDTYLLYLHYLQQQVE